jgi:DNA-binding MarR family transcriptional regulator
MDEQTELLREMRDLLRLIAEPALEKRDQEHRTALRELVGLSKLKSKAVLLMDGTKSRIAIRHESGIDQGDLSRLVKSLREKGLVTADEQPRLVITLPSKFFESTEK